MNAHLLQIELTPSEYKTILPETDPTLYPNEQYSLRMPRYKIAQCPICGSIYTAQVDTYSIRHWSGATTGECLFSTNEDQGCDHFILVHHFINLNRRKLVKSNFFINGSEVPYIIVPLLDEGGTLDIPLSSVYAVMHALPICTIENDHFTPYYDLYILTYYGEHAFDRRLKIVGQWQHGTPLHQIVPGKQSNQRWWDLSYWVEKEKLWWLDANDPKLPLRHEVVQKFPYSRIQGRKEEMTYRNGVVVMPLIDTLPFLPLKLALIALGVVAIKLGLGKPDEEP